MPGPLKDLKILDLTWALAGPFGTMLLSDLGAEVIKVERPGIGDVARSIGPIVDSVSTYFFSVNRGKKSVAIDLKNEKGRGLFLGLIKEMDVVVENFTPGTMAKLGLGYEALKAHNPRLIYASCSGYGQSGAESEKPSLDVIAQGRSGVMSITGEEGRGPVRLGVSLADLSAGMFLAMSIMAAAYERKESGLGQMIDISMVDSVVALEENAFVRYFATGEEPQRLGTKHPLLSPFQAFPTKDGYIVLTATGNIEQWSMFLEKIDCLDLLSDERFHNARTRNQYNSELEPILTEAIKKKTTREWIEAFESIGMPCGPLNTIADSAHDPLLISRNMFVDLPKSGGGQGTFRVVNTPMKFSRTPAGPEKGAPVLGEHTHETLSRLIGLGAKEIEELETQKIINQQ
ncbi:MAG: CaiB/BaiF CoA-transferase family protein [Thermodesulfobacteriota bacterium]